MDYKALYERYWATKQYKDRWLALYKQLYRYVIPNRDAFNVKWDYHDDGYPATEMIWDSTAMLAAYQRANDLHGLLLPQDRVWGSLSMNPQAFSKDTIDAYQSTMDEVNERIFSYLNSSNLSRMVSSSNLDLVGGTAALWVESISDNEPLYFRTIPAVTLYIEYTTDDTVGTAWFQCKMSARAILDAFPDYRGTRLNSLREGLNEDQIVIYGQIKEGEDKYFLYAILEDDHDNPLWATDRSYPQLIIYRDRVRPGETDGRGVGLDLLPTIIDLNKIVAYDRMSLAFKANPPMFYDTTSYFNPYTMRQWAGAMIAAQPGTNPLRALEMPSYPEILPKVQALQEIIMKGFQVDPLGEINSPVRTATEVSIRENRAQRTASTDISRLINEQPRQIYEVAAKILSERRLLSRDRQVTLNLNSKKLMFNFRSPLFDVQKQEDLNHFITNMQVKQQFYGQGAAMMTTNIPAVNEFLTEALNLKHDLFATKEQIQQYVEQAGQMAQQGALPQPKTSASPVKFPENPGVTI